MEALRRDPTLLDTPPLVSTADGMENNMENTTNSTTNNMENNMKNNMKNTDDVTDVCCAKQ